MFRREPTHLLTPARSVGGAGAGLSIGSGIGRRLEFEAVPSDQEHPLSATKMAPEFVGDAVLACAYTELDDSTHGAIIEAITIAGLEKDKTKITILSNGNVLLVVKSESRRAESLYVLDFQNRLYLLDQGAIAIKTYYVNDYLVVLSGRSNLDDVSDIGVYKINSSELSHHATVTTDIGLDLPSFVEIRKVSFDGEILKITTGTSLRTLYLTALG